MHSTYTVDYAKIYEPILYGWKEGAEHPWYATGMQRNAFEIDKLEDKSREELIKIIKSFNTNYQEVAKEPKKVASLHPTVKPVNLILYHMINSSKINDIVYDGFSGSGSTLIAAEKANRRARCIELEPKFVDVTITRWQELTGLQAVNQHGVKYDDIVSESQNNIILDKFFNLPESPECKK